MIADKNSFGKEVEKLQLVTFMNEEEDQYGGGWGSVWSQVLTNAPESEIRRTMDNIRDEYKEKDTNNSEILVEMETTFYDRIERKGYLIIVFQNLINVPIVKEGDNDGILFNN